MCNTMLARLFLVYCLEWMLALGYWFEVAGRLSISNRQLFVYTKNSSRKYYVNCTRYMVCWDRQIKLCSLGSPILWISLWLLSDLLYRLNCHVDHQPVPCFGIFGLCWTLDCWQQPSRWANHVITKEQSILLKIKPIKYQENMAL